MGYCAARSEFVALGGAGLVAEWVGAERRRKSEAQPNREGVASGSATSKFKIILAKYQHHLKPHLHLHRLLRLC